MATFKHIPQVKSLSISENQAIYTGPNKGVWNIIAHTDEGDYNFYNGITPGLRVEPTFFEKEGSQPCTLIYHTGTSQGTLRSGETANVIKEIPVQLILKRNPRVKKFKELETPDIDGAAFTVIYNSGRSENIESCFVSAQLEGTTLTYYYSYNGVEVSTSSIVDAIETKGLEVTIKKHSTLIYNAGDIPNPQDIDVRVTFTDGSSEEVQSFVLNPSQVRNGDNTITITYGKFSKDIPIKVNTNLKSSESLKDQLHINSEGNYEISGEVKLTSNIDTGDKIFVASSESATSTILNLQNHTLTTPRFEAYGSVIIKNGNIVFTNEKYGNIYLPNKDEIPAKSLTIENVNITSCVSKSAFPLLETQADNLTVKNCTLNFTTDGVVDSEGAQDKYLFYVTKDGAEIYLENVTTNAIIGPNGGFKNQKVTILNCNSSAGLYLPTSGEVIINGGNYSSSLQSACEIKAGDVTISNASFTSTAEKSHKATTGGTSTAGYDIAVVSNNNYAGGSVTVEEDVTGGAILFSDDSSNKITLTDNRVKEDNTEEKAEEIKTSEEEIEE